jgi:hypothetical protein
MTTYAYTLQKRGAGRMGEEKSKLVIALTPAASKRLIARGVMRLPEVQRALKHGTIVVALGTTNAFVAEELLAAIAGAQSKLEKGRYAAGVVTSAGLCVVPKGDRLKELIIKKGSVSAISLEAALAELSAGDVFIKGANALDPKGTAGILMTNRQGGTIGSALGIVMSRGVHFIIPMGLEKTVLYPIAEAAKRLGIERCYKALGWPVGIMPVHGKVITEVEALKLLGADDAFPIGAGGVAGAEGSVILCVEGSREKLDELMRLAVEFKGEPAVTVATENCTP